ncbi:MAG TPA: lysine transporter LysE [Rhodobacteraceae bacterium]|nr:lysine transporter LysE [Paracoccaceae bacterium]
MEAAHLIAFNLTLLAAIASPGPAMVFLSRTAMVHGRAAGISAALGLAFMAALWTLAALVGLDAIFTLFPWAYVLLKTLGALFLIYIAWTTWRHARAPVGATAAAASGRRMFLQGVLLNLGNPKSVLFAASVLVVIFPAGLSGTEKAVIFLNHLGVELLVQPLLAVFLSSGPVRAGYLRLKPVFDRIAAAVPGALGLRLFLDR